MCYNNPNIKNLHHWNWDGDIIIHECIVPASRWVLGYNKKKEYNIDVREFLVNDRNELIRKALNVKIKNYITYIKGDWELFNSRRSGSFDYRANIISSWVSENIGYIARKGSDPWQFPDETLFVEEGDCEDRSFLIASLLLGSGISNFNVRVAMGKVHTVDESNKKEKYDHVWVMYKDESGHWTLIEPLQLRSSTLVAKNSKGVSKISKSNRTIAEYIPCFLFNDQHLWEIPSEHNTKKFDVEISLRRRWKKWNPKFAGDVHQTIIQQALSSLPASQHYVIDALNRKFSKVFIGIGPVIDDIDRDLISYSPIDHFDNGYIKEGWDTVKARLNTFSSDNTDLDSFFKAAHAIADFYAHSSYVYFATLNSATKSVPIYDPEAPLPFVPQYTSGLFNLSSGKFTVNPYYWKSQVINPAAQWNGKIISGRYAQKKDTQAGLQNLLIEGNTYIPKSLLQDPEFFTRGALPHHNEIAVDDKKFDGKKHKLFPADQFSKQFNWRKDCAIRHVKKAFFDNWHK